MGTEKKYCCKNCNKVLFFGDLQEGVISKDCDRCGQRNVFKVQKVATETFELVKKPNPLNAVKRY